MHCKLKKLYMLLILVSFMFVSVSPAFAAGIAEGWQAAFWDDAAQTYKVGKAADFLGYNWKLWKIDDQYAYVITNGVVTYSKFHDSSNYYPTSTVRSVVNGYENNMKGYGGNAGGTSSLTWDKINGGSANYIAHSPTSDNGVDTDCLYLLSYHEATTMDPYIRMVGTRWWLRSPRVESVHTSHPTVDAARVDSNAAVHYSSVTFGYAVRPALMIDLKSFLFSSPLFKTAPSGKAGVNIGGGFALKDYDGADGWKFTVIDKNIKTPEILLGADGGKKIAVHYIVETTGKNMYLSALLYDKSGKLINYAKVMETKNKGAGIAELPVDNLPSGQYKIRFFIERINGEGEDDYASELTKEYEIFTPYVLKTAPNGKTGVKVNEGFTLAPYDGSEGWKLTESNENIAAPTVNIGMNVDCVSVFCTGEYETGEDRYISALLYDENGEIINYAKAAKITKASIFSGKRICVTAKIPLDNVKPGNYKIRFFYEQIKGGEENDIASNLTKEYDLRVPDLPNTAVLQNESAIMGSTSLDSVKIASQEKSAALLDEDYAGVSGVKETNLEDGVDITLTYDGEKAGSETAQFQIKLEKPIELAEGRQLAVFLPLPDREEEENEYLVLKDEDPADDMVTFTVPNVGKYFESGVTVPVMFAEINGDAEFDGEKSSSSGCNAGFGALALLALAGLALKKSNDE